MLVALRRAIHPYNPLAHASAQVLGMAPVLSAHVAGDASVGGSGVGYRPVQPALPVRDAASPMLYKPAAAARSAVVSPAAARAGLGGSLHAKAQLVSARRQLSKHSADTTSFLRQALKNQYKHLYNPLTSVRKPAARSNKQVPNAAGSHRLALRATPRPAYTPALGKAHAATAPKLAKAYGAFARP